jgi:glycosyltransferase involved in cell wall biosynthesis
MLLKNGHKVLFTGLYRPPKNVLHVKDAFNSDIGGRKMFLNPLLLIRLINFIRKNRPEIVQANGSDTLKYAVFTKLFLPRIKIIYRNISMISSWSRKDSFKHKFNKWLFTKVDFVTSVGDQALNDLLQSYDYPVAKSAVVRRGIPYFLFNKNEQRQWLTALCGFSEEDQILIHAGQFSEEKNHQFLINCFEKISSSQPHVKLVLLGEGKLFQHIQSVVAEKGLSSKVFFAGYQPEVQRWLSAADIFLLTSNVEGVPGVVLEAAMQNIPAVAVNTGGVGEAVIHQETGILIQQHDEEFFVSAVCSLIEDEHLKNKYGKRAGELVRSRYSLEQCSVAFEEIYSRVSYQKFMFP